MLILIVSPVRSWLDKEEGTAICWNLIRSRLYLLWREAEEVSWCLHTGKTVQTIGFLAAVLGKTGTDADLQAPPATAECACLPALSPRALMFCLGMMPHASPAAAESLHPQCV